MVTTNEPPLASSQTTTRWVTSSLVTSSCERGFKSLRFGTGGGKTPRGVLLGGADRPTNKRRKGHSHGNFLQPKHHFSTAVTMGAYKMRRTIHTDTTQPFSQTASKTKKELFCTPHPNRPRRSSVDKKALRERASTRRGTQKRCKCGYPCVHRQHRAGQLLAHKWQRFDHRKGKQKHRRLDGPSTHVVLVNNAAKYGRDFPTCLPR